MCPFGSLIPTRTGSSTGYRYGFQGQEKDDEIKGEGNSLNYTFRMHDPRVGRFFAVDPMTHQYPWYTPYQFAGNKVIRFVELEGLEEADPTGFDGWTGVGDSSSPAIQDVSDEEMTKRNVAFTCIVLSPLLVLKPDLATAYEGYSSWFATTKVSSYLTANSVFQTSSTTGLISGAYNLSGQWIDNDFIFDENINYFQPISAFVFKNQTLSNFSESSFNLYYDKGFKFEFNDGDKFLSSFISNHYGNKLSSKLEVNTGQFPVDDVLNTFTGVSTKVLENKTSSKIEEGVKTIKEKLDTTKKFKLKKSYSEYETVKDNIEEPKKFKLDLKR